MKQVVFTILLSFMPLLSFADYYVFKEQGNKIVVEKIEAFSLIEEYIKLHGTADTWIYSGKKGAKLRHITGFELSRERTVMERERAIKDKIALAESATRGQCELQERRGTTFYGAWVKRVFNCERDVLETYYEYERNQGTYDSTWYWFTYSIKGYQRR